MAKSEILLANAERFYVIERMTEKEVAQQVGVHERTIRRWKKEYNWEIKKDQYFQTTSLFHKEMYNFARKLMASIKYDLDNGRAVIELIKMKFQKQAEILYEVLSLRNFRRSCIDATGIGMQLSEDAQTKFGKFRVEQVMFTNKIKEELAYTTRTNFENKTVFIPKEHNIREDLHSVRRITTTANNIRFDAEHSENGHADRFWALSLALHAAGSGRGQLEKNITP